MNLKKYQSETVEKLIHIVKQKLIKNENHRFTFSAPTGSGKTLITIKFMDGIIYDLDLIKQNIQVCFIWISPGKGNLHIQSFDKILNTQPSNRKCILLKNLLSISRKRIKRNEILVTNWEQIKSDHNRSRTPSENYTFDDLLNNTKKMNRKIICIVDESHYSADTDKANDVIKIISPTITIRMSATPKEDCEVLVPFEDVINEGMIKIKIFGNYFNENNLEEISDQYIIKDSYDQRLKIKNEFEKLNKNINPLCLIQIPNFSKSDEREKYRKERIIKILEDLGEQEQNIGIYLDNDKKNIDYKNNFTSLRKYSNNINFLIFKQALDTGWDCSRSHILVKLRDIKSPTFLIQTVGRIIRMPEQIHYGNPILDNAYIYADITDPRIINGIYSVPNYKDLKCKIREDINIDIKLPTFYNSPTGKKSLKNGGLVKYKKIFDEYFNKKINIDLINADLTRPKNRIGKNFEIKEGIEINNNEKNIVEKELSDVDIQSELTIELYSICQNIIPSQSEPILRSLFREFWKEKLGLNESECYILFYKNKVYFKNLIEGFIKDECKFDDMTNWESFIWEPKCYDEELKFRDRKYKYYLYTPAAPYIGSSEVEIDFNSFIENALGREFKLIEWWFKNKSKSKTWFGIKCTNENSYPFYPDYLIKFNNGYLGIFDTKLGVYEESEDAIIKANALQKYILDRKNEGMKIIGGFVIPGKGTDVYYLNDSIPYNKKDENKKNLLEYLQGLK